MVYFDFYNLYYISIFLDNLNIVEEEYLPVVPPGSAKKSHAAQKKKRLIPYTCWQETSSYKYVQLHSFYTIFLNDRLMAVG